MRLLAIDTTGKSAKIVLIDDNIKIDQLNENEKQSENLMTHIDSFLDKNSLALSDIDVFGAVVGPGSFTGIRVGVATIKAFAFALKKPVIGINVFEVVASEIKLGVCLLNCTASSVYYAVIKNSKISEMGVLDNDQVNKFEKMPLFCLEEEHLQERFAYKFNVITDYNALIATAFANRLEAKNFAKTLEPLYLQLSQAERNLEKKSD